MNARYLFAALFLVVLLICAAYYAMHASFAVARESVQVRWLLSHRPTEVFANAADVFAQELNERTDGRLKLVVLQPEDVGWTDGDIPNTEVERMLRSGQTELATAYTVPLGKEHGPFWAMSLPYLADTYADAERVIDSDAAHGVLSSMDTDDIRALAFTMSGGLRIIASKNFSVTDIDSMRGKRIATSGGPVAEETLRALGAIPVIMNVEGGNVDKDSVDGVETTYSRLSGLGDAEATFTKYISETNHSIFLTSVLASAEFLDSLSPEDRTALIESARIAARIERADSHAFNLSVKEKLAQNGSVIIDNEVPVAALREATRSVYGTEAIPSDTLRAFTE